MSKWREKQPENGNEYTSEGSILYHGGMCHKSSCSCFVQGGDDADGALRSHLALIFWDISYSRGQWHYLLHPFSTLPNVSLLCQTLQTGHPKSNTLLHHLIEALDFPCILAQH